MKSPNKTRAALSLLLLLPAPTLGVAAGMVFLPDTTLGRGLFIAAKIWLLALPAAWFLIVEREKPSLSPVRHGGWLAGFLLGIALSAAILAAYLLVGRDWIDAAAMRHAIRQVGLGNPLIYAAGGIYWMTINAALEEYVWRWFVVRQCRRLMPAAAAVAASAAAFTVHHLVALALYLPTPAVAISGVGIFAAGAVWSWCYVRYRSIWPGYISHALVDLTVFAIGWHLVFT